MNEMLLENFNALVHPRDEVWHLGDFCMSKNNLLERTEYFAKRLNGQLNWVFGNHDHRDVRKAEGFNVKTHYHELRNVGPDRNMFVLMHYAMRVWNKRHHGAIHLYGHSHGSLPEDPKALSCDVGVDCWDWKPVHMDEIIQRMDIKRLRLDESQINWRGEDHHSSQEVD